MKVWVNLYGNQEKSRPPEADGFFSSGGFSVGDRVNQLSVRAFHLYFDRNLSVQVMRGAGITRVIGADGHFHGV